MAKIYVEENLKAAPLKKSFFRKYFMDGQALEDGALEVPPPDADFLDRLLITHRKWFALLLPVGVMLTLWILTAIRYEWFSLYETRWQMPLVMMLGSTVGGMTAESGGAVAFPFMTLVMHSTAEDARDFSLLIESFGMLCAMFSIFLMKVKIEDKAILFGTIGSVPGLLFGFEFCDHWLSGSEKKMLFVSIWASFAMALFLLNTERKRTTFDSIQCFSIWKAAVLMVTGFVGGVLTAFTGSGIDICLFSIVTILFRVSEKTATPTTVVLMGMNALAGAYYRVAWIGDVSETTMDYLKVSVPVALIMAPLASFIGSHFHRQVLAVFVYILEALAVIGFVVTGPPVILLVIGAGIIIVGFAFFYFIGKAGERLLEQVEREKANSDVPKI